MSTPDPTARPAGSPPPSGPGFPQPPASSPAPNQNHPPHNASTSSNTSPHPADNPAPSPSQTTITVPADNAHDEADIARWKSLFYNSSLGITIAVPVLMLMPPRKMDLYTFGLGVSWFMSAGYVVEQRTGKGLLWHIGSRIPSEGNRRRLEEERAQREEEGQAVAFGGRGEGGLAQREGERREAQRKQRGMLGRIWYGDEGDDWVAERARKEKEALEEGRGYGGLIVDQVREVFGNGERDDPDEDREKKS